MKTVVTYIAAILLLSIYVVKGVATVMPKPGKEFFKSLVQDGPDSESENTEEKKEAEPKALYINSDFLSINYASAEVKTKIIVPRQQLSNKIIYTSIPTPPPEL